MDRRPSKDLVVKLVLVALFVFAVVSNIQLVVRNYRLHKILVDKREATSKQDLANRKLRLLIAYNETLSFQEVEARRRLALKKPDETVFVIKDLADTDANPILSDDLYRDVAPVPAAPKANIWQWWDYFFK